MLSVFYNWSGADIDALKTILKKFNLDSITVRNITVTGIFNHHPLKVNFSFPRKQFSDFSQN